MNNTVKYMNFNSSCSYTGIANLLAFEGIDIEDYQIALEIGLPYLLEKDGRTYKAGPMLQSRNYFNLYLKTVGLVLEEYFLDKLSVPSFLKSSKPAMLGVTIPNHSKHAIIFKEFVNGLFHFINNKRIDSEEPSEFHWSESELIELLDDQVVIGRLTEGSSDINEDIYYKSVQNITNLASDIIEFSSRQILFQELMESMNTLFRPILLDSVPMFTLMKENGLAEDVKEIQRSFIDLIKEKPESIILKDVIDLKRLLTILNEWKSLMIKNLKSQTQ